VRKVTAQTEDGQLFGIEFLKESVKNSVRLFFKTGDNLSAWWNAISSICVYAYEPLNFDLQSVIGHGGFSRVWKAFDKENDRIVAIKEVEKGKIKSSQSATRGMKTEIEIMRGIRHPNVVQLYKVCESFSAIFLVMELVECGSLSHLLKQDVQLAEPFVKKLMLELLRAVDYLHQQNVIHRDIKPGNILLENLTMSPKIMLCDFGLSCPTGETNQAACGSPGYVAPEILNKKAYNEKIDLFSCGIVLFEMIARYNPFDHRERAKIIEKNRLGKVPFLQYEWIKVTSYARSLCEALT
jgi:serine/threonine protein kinase